MNYQVAKDQNYSCIGCGNCCKNWLVPLNEEEIQRFSQKEYENLCVSSQKFAGNSEGAQRPTAGDEPCGFTPRGEGGRVPPFIEKIHLCKKESADNPRTNTPSMAFRGHTPHCGDKSIVENGCLKHFDHQCLFLEPDMKCTIQREISYQSKPLYCRQFPFAITECPDGLRVSLSYFCPAAAKNEGEPLSNHPELTDQALSAFSKYVVKEPITLAVTETMGWADYLSIEEEIIKVWETRELSVPQKLIALYFRVQERAKAKFNHREVKPFEEALEAARNPFPQKIELKAKLIRALFIGFAEGIISRSDRGFGFLLSLLGGFAKLTFGWGNLFIATLRANLNLQSIENASIEDSEESIKEFIERYFKLILFRRQIFFEHGLFRGASILIIVYALLIWYSKAIALTNDRTSMHLEDFHKAGAIIEKYYLLHTPDTTKLLSGSAFSSIFEGLMNNQAVAGSLLCISSINSG